MQELGYNIEAWYLEEGMAFCGHFSDGGDDYYEYGGMSADDMENDLPEWAEEIFGLVTRTRDDEAEREDEEDDEDNDGGGYIPNQYDESEKTQWFKAKVKPTHEGLYEVKTKEWPFPQMMVWNDEKWCIPTFIVETTAKVTDWRGLIETEEIKEAILAETLEDLKVQLEERFA